MELGIALFVLILAGLAIVAGVFGGMYWFLKTLYRLDDEGDNDER